MTSLPGCRIVAVLLAAVLLTGCSPWLDARIDSGIRPLAKAEGWRPGLQSERAPDLEAVLEIAADRATAERAWRENMPDRLTARSGRPAEPGRYADLSGVDFGTEVVAVFSAGESGSCPGWLTGIRTGDTAAVNLTTGATPAQACTSDNNPYTMMLAIEADLLPESLTLPTTDVALDGRKLDHRHWVAVVSEYPLQR